MTDPASQPPAPDAAPTLGYLGARPRPRLRTSSVLLLSALLLSMLALILSAIANLLSSNLWTRYGAGEIISGSEMARAGMLHVIATLALPVTFVLTFIMLEVWLYRAYKVLPTLTREPLRFTPLKAIGSWFYYYRYVIGPFEVVKEIYTVTRHRPRDAFTPLVGSWWACWLFGNIVSLAAHFARYQKERGATDAQFNADYYIWNTLDIPLYLLAGSLLVAIVLRTQTQTTQQQPRES